MSAVKRKKKHGGAKQVYSGPKPSKNKNTPVVEEPAVAEETAEPKVKKNGSFAKQFASGVKSLYHSKVGKVVTALLLILLLFTSVIFAVPAFLRFGAEQDYKRLYDVLNEQPEVTDMPLDIENMTEADIMKALFNDAEFSIMGAIQEAYGENTSFDFTKLIGFEEYVKKQFEADKQVFKQSDGSYKASAAYLLTLYDRYITDVEIVEAYSASKEAVLDMYTRVMDGNNFNADNKSLKESSTFTLEDVVGRVVIDEELNEELLELGDKIQRIVVVVYGNIIKMNELGSGFSASLIPEELQTTFSFDKLDENMRQILWLASAEEITYGVNYTNFTGIDANTEEVNKYMNGAEDKLGKLESYLKLVPIWKIEDVAVSISDNLNEYIIKTLNTGDSAEVAYVNKKLNADYWVWGLIAGVAPMDGDEVVSFTDYDTAKDYYVHLQNVVGAESVEERLAWGYAHIMTFNYLTYLSGGEDTTLMPILGPVNDELSEEYGNLYYALITDGMRKLNPFSDYTSTLMGDEQQ